MWKLKVLIQFFLAFLPNGEKINYVLSHLNGGFSPKKQLERVINLTQKMSLLSEYLDLEGSTIVEIGTGWDAINTIIFYFMGAKNIYTFDHVPHVRFKLVQDLINQIENNIDKIAQISSLNQSLLIDRLSRLKEAKDIRQFFDIAGISYMAPGDATQTGLSDGSVDLVYSYAVLEHVPENVINGLIIESKRILKKNGICFHAIGLHDHYADVNQKISKVNFLQYSEDMWNFFVKNKISYHNRLREREFLNLFKFHEAKILKINNELDQEDINILKKIKIDKRFSGMTDQELAVYYTEIICSF